MTFAVCSDKAPCPHKQPGKNMSKISTQLRGYPLFIVSALLAVLGHSAEYTVSPRGDNAAAGTKAAPWRTLGHACEMAGPGDTVLISEGIYRETLTPKRSGESGKPIRFQAAAGERVVLSGAEPITGTWQHHRGNIFALKTTLTFKQLFVDGKMMPEARWPNSPPGDLMDYNRAVAGKGTGYETLSDTNLPTGNWSGGVVLMWPGQWWFSNTRRIAEYRPGQALSFARSMKPKQADEFHAADPYLPREGNFYVLMGSLDGLDFPGEWFLAESARVVYLWAPDGECPEKHTVEAKQRDLACDLRGRGFIEIRGVDIFGAAVMMRDAHDCLLEACRLRYVEHDRDCERENLPPALNVVTGKNNVWRNCLVAYAATEVLCLGGESNRLENCVLHDANYLGTSRGGLDVGRSVAAQVKRCTIYRAGRDLVGFSGCKRLRFERNDLYAANMLNDDAAAIYGWGTDGEGSIIAYNWIHDNPRCNGVYLDNFCKSFIVHHNVIWNSRGNSIRLNCDAISHQIFNNTLAQVSEPFGTYAYSGHVPTMKGTRIINNLINARLDDKDPRIFVQGDLGPELHHNGPGAVDSEGYPESGSKAIDAGVVIPNITDGFQGKAPDLGAYERDGPRWTVGADWSDTDAASVKTPPKNLAYRPRPPLTDATMIKTGLVLWLDTRAPGTIDRALDGTLLAWRDQSSSGLVAKPTNTNGSLRVIADGLHGKPIIRSNGSASLTVGGLRRGPGAVTALIVSQGLDASGPTWGRLIKCFTGENKSWELPNWEVLRPEGQYPRPYAAQIFCVQRNFDTALADITLLAAAADMAEVLVFDRALRFDEREALEQYLKTKWGLL